MQKTSMESPPSPKQVKSTTAQIESEKERLVEEFKRVYKERGAHDFQSHIKYLAGLADLYHQKGADNSDWVCLIKAHALYNSVAARDRENREKWSEKAFEVQNTYWGEAIQLSYKQQREITHTVRSKLIEIRSTTRSKLDHLKTNFTKFECSLDHLTSEKNRAYYEAFMEDIESVSKYCTDVVVDVIKYVVEKAVEIVGEPPCHFCAAAMGSIARGEATPYSDLEFLFLIEISSADIVKYFESLAMIVYFLIGNLQETKLRYMAISELDFWFTDECTNGLKIDGLQPWAGNIPTGNGSVEQHNHFICTVEELASRYKKIFNNPHPKESLRGDMTAMLSNLVLIFGNTNLLATFKAKIRQLKPNEARQYASKMMLENDVKKFKFYPDASFSRKRNMKIDIYRYPSMLLMNLKIVNLRDECDADTFRELVRAGILSKSIANHLRFAFCCSLYIRLSAYLYHDSQNENISLLSMDPDLLATRDQWYVDQPLLFHMMMHLMPLKQAILKGRLTTDLEISPVDAKRSIMLVSYCSADYETCHATLKELHTDGLDIHTEYPIYIDCALRLGFYEEAERLATQQLEFLLQLLEGKNDAELAHAYNLLGNALEYQGNYEDAKMNHLKSLEIKLRLYGESDHIEIANTYNNLAILCDNEGDCQKAEMYTRKSLEMRQRLYDNVDHPDIAASLTNLGEIYYHQRNYTTAEAYHTQSLEMSQRLYGNADHPDIAGSYNNLGNICEDYGDFKKAEVYHVKSLEMRQRLHGSADHPDISTCFESLGNACESQGDYAKAEKYHIKALEINQRLYGDSGHPELASSYNNLGIVYNSQGNYQKAEDYHIQSLDMRMKIYRTSDNPDIAASYNNLGNVYENRKDYAKAESYHIKSLDMRLRLYGDTDHPDIADSYCNLGNVFLHLGDYEKAELYHRNALEMQQRRHGDCDHPDIAIGHVNLGEAYCKQELYQKAEQHCSTSLEMLGNLYGDFNHPVTATAYRIQGQVYCGQKRFEKAQDMLSKSLGMTNGLFRNSNHPSLADCYSSLGDLYKAQGQHEKAKLHYNKAIEMRQQNGGSCDDPDIASGN